LARKRPFVEERGKNTFGLKKAFRLKKVSGPFQQWTFGEEKVKISMDIKGKSTLKRKRCLAVNELHITPKYS